MTTTTTSTIALVTCDVNSKINFAHVVGELRRSLDRSQNSSYALTWDQDDIAAFDFESTRIVLSIENQSNQIDDWVEDRLLISVGPPFGGLLRRDPEIAYEKLCSMIAERICTYYETKSVHWQQTEEGINAEAVDQIFDQTAMAQRKSATVDFEAKGTALALVPPQRANIVQLSVLPNRAPRSRAKGDTRQQPMHAIQLRQPAFNVTSVEAANDVSLGVLHDCDRLRAIRTALYEVQDEANCAKTERTSPISRLSATALDVTLVMVCLPVGAAMLTYHVFRGGELRHTSQMITLTGLFLASSKVFTSIPLNTLFY